MDILKKITLVYNINGLIPLILKTWAVVYLTKYINENIVMDKLSIAKIAIGAMTIFILQYAKKDSILDFITININKVYFLYSLLNVLVILVVLIDPFTYIIVEAVQLGSIKIMIGTTFGDIINSVFQGRNRTNFNSTWEQTKCFGYMIGGGLGFIFSNINLNIAVAIIIIADLIIIPGNWYLFSLIKKAQNS